MFALRALGTALALGLAVVQPLKAQVPTDFQLPGTQDGEATHFDQLSNCSGCHGGYDPEVAPHDQWMGGMMAQAGRDPLFWAAVAITEQDLPGAGDLCIRCHSPRGWLGGRSVPTDASALTSGDGFGVECDLCHSLSNTDGSEWPGVQIAPFIANSGGLAPEGYYGSGEFVLYGDKARLGPYAATVARHQDAQARFQRSSDLCGTCHDVSNPATGDLAHNHGAFTQLQAGTFSGVYNSPVDGKAAFNNPPYAYGVVERTYSEHQASGFASTPVSAYDTLPEWLQDGAIEEAWEDAQAAGRGGDYADGTERLFSCQSCHTPPTTGHGCDKSDAPLRYDLPQHDMTGGNVWTPDAISYLDAGGKLVLGGGMTTAETAALTEGKDRALDNLELAASLAVVGDQLRVVNLTGHKLISGFPEGRRMWLRTRWLDANGAELRVDGAYGPITVTHEGQSISVDSILDLHDPNLRVYQAKPGIDQGWAAQLLALGLPAGLPLEYDRDDGTTGTTLGELSAMAPGTAVPTFRFALNNVVVSDNRIPPWGMSYDEAMRRNTIPVPADQYGAPVSGETYDFWDEVALSPPAGAALAEVKLMYQTTSWEYLQFLDLANDGSVAHLATTGDDVMDAWRNTGMAAPVEMAETLWCQERGTGEDLELYTEVDDDGDRDLCRKEATGGEVLEITLRSPEGTFDGSYGGIGIQLYVGTPPGLYIPGIWLERLDATLVTASLSASGYKVTIPLPHGYAGISMRMQGLVLAPGTANNGQFASTDAHDLTMY